MKGPKVTVIGAGSFYFGRKVIYQMAASEIMKGGTLALVDTQKPVLDTMVALARKVFRKKNNGIKLIGSTDRKKVLAGSDFIINAFCYRNAHFRGIDTEIAAKHGMRMCSSDTIGPGGIFRAMREVPIALAVAKDTSRLCPAAWIINYVNPTTVLGIALKRYAPQMKSFAICDAQHEPWKTLSWCKMAGILSDEVWAIPAEVYNKLDIAAAGVNHFTWLIRFNYDGKDMLPAMRKRIVENAQREKDALGEHSKKRYNWAYTLKLFDIFGAVPTVVAHSKEYVPYFQEYGVADIDPEPIALFDADKRVRRMTEHWQETKKYARGKLSIAQFLRKTNNDVAMDIIENMWGNLGRAYYVNTFNNGAVTNMPDDAFLELRSALDMKGPRPYPVGEMPRGLRGLQQQVLDTHELTAQAAVSGDRKILRRAMLTDPIGNNIRDADNCISDLLAAEKEALPSYWY